MQAEKKLFKAKLGLLLDAPFWGSLLCNLKAEQANIPTMATDGKRLLWSAAQVEKWSLPEVQTVLAHEVGHCMLLHHTRRGDRDSETWNKACDYAVNLILESANVAARNQGKPLPFVWPVSTPPLLDNQYAGMSAEAIYKVLKQKEQGQGGQGQGQGQGSEQGKGQPSMGDVLDSPAQDEDSQGKEEATWQQATIQAAQAAKGRGEVPGEVKTLIDNILNPKVDWKEVLRRFIRDRAKDDYNFSRPNRRYMASGFVLPSLYSQRIGTIGIIRDTSGSTQDWQKEILSELASIISECKPEKVVVIDADSRVQRVLELDPSDELPTDALGGGGTDFCPALEKMENFQPVCCIYLTDLDGTFPTSEPSFPVLWATNNSLQVPFGEIVKID